MMQKNRFFFLASFVSILFLFSNCTTNNQADLNTPQEVAPEITNETKSEEAIKIAIQFGGDRIKSAVKNIIQQKAVNQSLEQIENELKTKIVPFQNHQLMNAASLYSTLSVQIDPSLFELYFTSGRSVAKQIAWQWAAERPSPAIATKMEEILSSALQKDEEQDFIMPAMGQALVANKLVSAYSLLRQGLMEKGDEEYAKAMSILNPTLASDDFLVFLSLTPIEELRMLTQKSLNPYTAHVVMRHLLAYPPNISHANFEQIFLFAVSRNQSLSEVSNQILRVCYLRNRDGVAAVLSRLPTWIQVSYLEYARRNLSPEMTQFLASLKDLSNQDQVIEEIDEIIR